MEMTLISMPQECVTDVIQWWKKSLRTKDVNIPDNVSQRVTTDSFWSLHTEQNCSVCTHYVAQDKEGRPAKDRWLKKRQREASASFDPPDCSTPPKQSTLVTDAQTSPFQLKTLPILQDADATDLTERSSFVDCQTSPIKQLQSESVTWVTLLVKERKNIVWLGREANCHQPPMMQTEFISRQTYCVL